MNPTQNNKISKHTINMNQHVIHVEVVLLILTEARNNKISKHMRNMNQHVIHVGVVLLIPTEVEKANKCKIFYTEYLLISYIVVQVPSAEGASPKGDYEPLMPLWGIIGPEIGRAHV